MVSPSNYEFNINFVYNRNDQQLKQFQRQVSSLKNEKEDALAKIKLLEVDVTHLNTK